MSRILPLQKRGLAATPLIYGCMGLGGADWSGRTPLSQADIKEAHEAVDAALSIGIHFFDHANIYKSGNAEKAFSYVLKERPSLRSEILLQSKCGIRFADEQASFTRFDFSKEYILHCVDGILQRLGVDYLDILLLHRPDPLVEPEEVAAAFDILQQAGKVRWFGVSNMSGSQIEFLKTAVAQPIVVNQLEMSLLHHDFVNVGININRQPAIGDIFPEGTIEYCRTHNIQIQAWGPLAQGAYTGAQNLAEAPPVVQKTAAKLSEYAEKKHTTVESILIAWLLRHPAGIQAVIGTRNKERILACKDAANVELSREEWYDLWITARGEPMP